MKHPIFLLFFIGCVGSSDLIKTRIQSKSISTAKTYSFFGKSYKDSLGGPLAAAPYFWLDSIQDGRLLSRTYTWKNKSKSKRELYEYDKQGELQKRRLITKDSQDSSIVDFISFDSTDPSVVSTERSEKAGIVATTIKTQSNDTTYVAHYGNDKYWFTSIEVWETPYRNHTRIVKPDLSDIVNVYIYNEKGDQIRIEKYEKGSLVGTSMETEYRYDEKDRIVFKQVKIGSGNDSTILTTEVTIYN